MKKLVILLAFITLNCALLLLQSCCRQVDRNFTLQSISANPQKLAPSRFDKNFDIDKAIRYDSVGIEVINDFKIAISKIKGSWINQSFACGDSENRYEHLDSISIISNEDYNVVYPKGTDLKNIIKARIGRSMEDVDITTLESRPIYNANIIFTFYEAPSENKIHNITIKYKLKNGNEFQSTVVGLKLNK